MPIQTHYYQFMYLNGLPFDDVNNSLGLKCSPQILYAGGFSRKYGENNNEYHFPIVKSKYVY